jgi:hypothetical protein
MKKVIIIFIGCVVYIYAVDCLCQQEISDAYSKISGNVTKIIDNQTRAINDDLIPEIEKNTDDIKEQSKVIEKIIKAETRKAVQNTQIVFLLQKIAELKTAGEM